MVGGPLAHPVEQGTFNPKVRGSRPRRPTNSPWSGAVFCGAKVGCRLAYRIRAKQLSTSSSDPGRQSPCQGLIQCREQVPVGAKGHLDRRMAQPLHDCLRVSTLGDEQGGVGVPQVVVAQPWG